MNGSRGKCVRAGILILFAVYCGASHAYLFALLGRAAVVGRTASAAGTMARVGTVSRAGVATRSFNWVGREVAKSAIHTALSANGHSAAGEIQQDQCLAVEFDGSSNYVANYCDYPVEIARFARQNARGEITFVECQGCIIEPMQYRQFSSSGYASAFLGADLRPAAAQERAVVSPSASGPAPRGKGMACPFGTMAQWDQWYEMNGPGWGSAQCVPSYGAPPNAPPCGPTDTAFWWERRFGQIVPVACVGGAPNSGGAPQARPAPQPYQASSVCAPHVPVEHRLTGASGQQEIHCCPVQAPRLLRHPNGTFNCTP